MPKQLEYYRQGKAKTKKDLRRFYQEELFEYLNEPSSEEEHGDSSNHEEDDGGDYCDETEDSNDGGDGDDDDSHSLVSQADRSHLTGYMNLENEQALTNLVFNIESILNQDMELTLADYIRDRERFLLGLPLADMDTQLQATEIHHILINNYRANCLAVDALEELVPEDSDDTSKTKSMKKKRTKARCVRRRGSNHKNHRKFKASSTSLVDLNILETSLTGPDAQIPLNRGSYHSSCPDSERRSNKFKRVKESSVQRIRLRCTPKSETRRFVNQNRRQLVPPRIIR